MKQEYLSDIELYFTSIVLGNTVKFVGDEFKHITKVMRHSVGDLLHATDGIGNYYQASINEISNGIVYANIASRKNYRNEFENIIFCFPRLKSNDRFDFELEKAIELGITNFIILNTKYTIPKGEKIERWNKIALSAMKQSLRTYLPKIEYLDSLKEINKLSGRKIVFDQKGDIALLEYLDKNSIDAGTKNLYFIFGPEGGLSESEINTIDEKVVLNLTTNRLRAETAVIVAASAISLR